MPRVPVLRPRVMPDRFGFVVWLAACAVAVWAVMTLTIFTE